MRGAVYVNGKIAPADQAVVPVYDHGFVYGEGVYETLRTYNRVPFLYDRHMRRLRAVGRAPAARRAVRRRDDAAVDRPDGRAPPGELDEAYIRILLTRGVGDLNYDPKSTPDADHRHHRQAVRGRRRRGCSTTASGSALVDMLRNHPKSVNPIIKSNNLLNNALAMQAAYRAGAEEALMCNYRGELTECSQANFFMVRGGAALTPQSDAGLLEGVTRAFIFELGREIGIDVREETLFPKDLETRRRDVHHVDDARAVTGGERRRPRRRHRQARAVTKQLLGARISARARDCRAR